MRAGFDTKLFANGEETDNDDVRCSMFDVRRFGLFRKSWYSETRRILPAADFHRIPNLSPGYDRTGTG